MRECEIFAAKRRPVSPVPNLRREALPLLGELSAVRLTEGSPALRLEQDKKKERTINIIVGDGLRDVPKILRLHRMKNHHA